jgi:hypothetical protein
MTDLDAPLPAIVTVSEAFSRRMPTQRVVDTITRAEGAGFGEIAQTQPMRIIAFRALMRDYPDRDVASLWLHAYDVEVEIAETNPTNGSLPTPAPPSGPTGISTPTT